MAGGSACNSPGIKLDWQMGLVPYVLPLTNIITLPLGSPFSPALFHHGRLEACLISIPKKTCKIRTIKQLVLPPEIQFVEASACSRHRSNLYIMYLI